MNKRLPLLTFITALVLSACSSKAQDVFPDVVRVSKTGSMTRVKGTKLFVNAPGTYTPFEKLIRYQKNDNTYFQVMEVPNSSFTAHKSKMSKQAIESQGAEVEVYESVTYNGFEGLYMEGPSKTAGETKIVLAFGDETFVVMVVGVCGSADKDARQELRNLFSTFYYDKAYPLNPLELANFQLDETITGFKYAAMMGNVFFYTPTGKADMKSLLDFSCYQVMPLEAGSFEKMKELMASIQSGLYPQGILASNYKEEEIVINGNKALEVTMDIVDKAGKKGTFYQVGIFQGSSSSGVLFMGADADGGAYLNKLKATARSIRF